MAKFYLLVKEITVEYEGTDTIPLNISTDVEVLKNSIPDTEWEEHKDSWISWEEELGTLATQRYKISEISLI